MTTHAGPAEMHARHHWRFDLRILRDAIVLDLAGATAADVEAADETLRTARGIKDDWSYFAVLVRQAIADRVLTDRALAFEAARKVPATS